MDFDLLLILGLFFGALTIPAIVSAFADRRAPRMPAVVLLLSGSLVYFAIDENPDRYTFDTLDDIFLSVVARYLT